ncbi:MAG TPA: DUF5825 family protein [Amycolatopsis sp.]|uniref:DUF5825 family protein n=1 Tax=Amycolatopsis sp. TaxID=37632 RepID=UPI002B4628E5|nr:DUF5825 family protein [Amycolatopsis sp.]HKS46199.1 DUF5825 family protein [Amycolatopsis sp.]
MTVDQVLDPMPRSPVRLALWRDRDPEARALPGMYLGKAEADIGTDPVAMAASLVARGVRCVGLTDPVELGDGRPERALLGLALVRELTSFGTAVDWEITLGADRSGTTDWRLLTHLYPPRATDVSDEAVREWRNFYHITRCGYRHGPRFLEVRDYRLGTYRRLVIRNRNYRRFLDPLLRGTNLSSIPAAEADAYLRQGLVIRDDELVLWLPYRIRQWPLSHIMS